MSKDTIRQTAVVLSTAATIIMNILANALPLNGQNTGEISDRFPVFFVPAGYVFSIWGLIYIGLIAYAVFQALPVQKTNPRMRSTGWPVVFGMAMNFSWLFFWHYNIFPLTEVAMLGLLASLIVVYLRLRSGNAEVSNVEKWSTRLPFSVYLGWISVATIANTSDVLYHLRWNGAPLRPEVWAVIMLGAALAITAAMLLTRRDIAYAAVIVWASVGIAVKQASAALVPTAAWAVAMLVGVGILITAIGLALKGSTKTVAAINDR